MEETGGEGPASGDRGRECTTNRGGTSTGGALLTDETDCQVPFKSAHNASLGIGGYGEEEENETEGFADANIYVVYPPSLMNNNLLSCCDGCHQQRRHERRRRRRHDARETHKTVFASDSTREKQQSAGTRLRHVERCETKSTDTKGRRHTRRHGHRGRDCFGDDQLTDETDGARERRHFTKMPSRTLCGICRQKDDGMQSELLRICMDLIRSNRIRNVQWNNPQLLQGQLLQMAVVVMPTDKIVAAKGPSIQKWREKYASLRIRVDIVPAGTVTPAKSGRSKPSALSCQFWEAQAFPIDAQKTITVNISPFSYTVASPAAINSATGTASAVAGVHGSPAAASVRDSHAAEASSGSLYGNSSWECPENAQQQEQQDKQSHQPRDEGKKEPKASAIVNETDGSAAAIDAGDEKKNLEQSEVSRRFSEDYSSALVAEEEEREEEEINIMNTGKTQRKHADVLHDVPYRSDVAGPSHTSHLQQTQQRKQQQQRKHNKSGGGTPATEVKQMETEVFGYIADIKILMTVNPHYLGKPLELELSLAICPPADVDLLEKVEAMRESVQLPVNAWAACHGLNCTRTASMQSALYAPAVDLLAVPFSSCFTGGWYGPLQRFQAAASAAAAATGTLSATRGKFGGGGYAYGEAAYTAAAMPSGNQAERSGPSATADSLAAVRGTSGGGRQADASGGKMERNAATEGKADTAPEKQEVEEQGNKDEAVSTQNWWAPPNINSNYNGPTAPPDMQIHGDRISRTMELLVQSFASLATTNLKDGGGRLVDAEDRISGGWPHLLQHRIVCPLSVHRPLQVTTALVDSFMYVQIENLTESTAITIEKVVLRSVHSYAEGELPVLLQAGDQYSVLLRLEEYFLSHQAPRWDSRGSSGTGAAGEAGGGGAAGGRAAHARGAGTGGGSGGSSTKGKYSSGKVVLPLCLKWQVEGFFLSGTPAVWSQFGAECQLPTRTPLQVTITSLAAAAPSEIFTAVLSVTNNEPQEVELMALLPRDIYYQQQQQTQTQQQQHQQQYYSQQHPPCGKPFMLQQESKLPPPAVTGDPPPLIPLTSKKDLGLAACDVKGKSACYWCGSLMCRRSHSSTCAAALTLVERHQSFHCSRRIPSGGSQSTYLQFLATRSGPHPLPPILLLDKKNNRKILARGGQMVVVF